MSQSFRTYTPLTQTILKNLKKTGILNKRLKRLSDEEIIGETVFTYQDMFHTLDFLILAEEHYWSLKKRPSIFLESSSVAHRLYKATYDAKWMSGIEMPFDSFILSIPKDFSIDGVTIPGCLVTWMPFDEMEHRAVRPLCRKAGVPEPGGVNVPDDYRKSMTLHISYQDPYDSRKITYGRCVIPQEFFGTLLRARTLEEFREEAGDYQSAFKHLVESSEADIRIQFTLLKIILAMAVYNQATDRQQLTPGLPGTRVQVDGMISSLRPQHQTLRMAPLKRAPKGPVEDHYRSFHFRQLRAERYYQGSYADVPRGSRWSFVSDAWISSSGKEIDPYTQKVGRDDAVG